MWVTQMNHIVMDVNREPYRDWFSSQVSPPVPLMNLAVKGVGEEKVRIERGQVWSQDSPPTASLQLAATCNVEQSFFNDWFSGHLNFQIEHQ